MDPTIPTPTVCSTVTSSSFSTQVPPSTPFQHLEISLISAQNLTAVTKSMRTYAVAWIQPNRKLTTKTDQQGHTHPTWNEKFTFRVEDRSLLSDDTNLTVEIYTVSWFRDVLVGTVRVLISDLLAPPNRAPLQNHPKNIRFVALQVRRPSGSPQGILNMGVTLLDSTMKSMPLHNYALYPPSENLCDEIEKKESNLSLEQQRNEYQDNEKKEVDAKIQLWRSLNTGSSIVNNDDFPVKPGSVNNGSMCNGSMVNGSELCSDIGPSASIVAAELAKKPQPSGPPPNPSNQLIKLPRNGEETGSSILEDLTIEEAKAKGYRIRTNRERARTSDSCNDSELAIIKKHSRRNSDSGMFSCFGNALGIEFTIVCGASNNPGSNKVSNNTSRRKIKSSEANSI